MQPGWAYMVDHRPYLDHVKKAATQDEVRMSFCWVDCILTAAQISTCAGFAAIHLANLKGIKGHRTSGVGGVCCARHGCWRPNGLGDLQVGERYVVKQFLS